jgi:hypothetical protein
VQIIHPDQFGNPLWINGGLSKNKHRDSRDRLKVIEEYMLETREPHWAADIDPDGGGGFWYLWDGLTLFLVLRGVRSQRCLMRR